ncbi:multicopper oxidase domain-containing protein [Dethiosulfatarculus sandiegensis]|nr:multicopper oxidase domain-containing protein [Dethiosulfatarculus sandiegensis]
MAADGLAVEPLEVKRLLIGVAETYDLLVTMPSKGSCELRATAHDSSSYASIWLGRGKPEPARRIPAPDLYHNMGELSLERVFALTPAGTMGMEDALVEAGVFDLPGMVGMKDMKGMKGMEMNHSAKKMPPSHSRSMKMANTSKKTVKAKHHKQMTMEPGQSVIKEAGSGRSLPPWGKRFSYDFSLLSTDVSSNPRRAMDGGPSRPWPPYTRLRSVGKTSFDHKRPVREIRLTLDGDMERYVWLLNNRALSEDDDILIKKGEVVRFIMINRTMMHHPMHLHGHFFRVLNGQGDHAPLKHTVDVTPMSTTVIEFKANEFGDWFFHCHLLYHMKAGMARMVHYQGYEPLPEVTEVRSILYKESWCATVQYEVLSNMGEGMFTVFDTRSIFNLDWELGWQMVDEPEWEVTPSYSYYMNRFTSWFVGADILSREDESEKIRGVLGLNYLLPLNIETSAWLDSDAGFRVGMQKDWRLTPRLGLMTGALYDSHERWEGSLGLSYMLNGNLSLVARWHSDFAWGVGVKLSF